MKKFLALFLSALTLSPLGAQTIRNITTASAPEAVGFSSNRLGRIDKWMDEYIRNEQLPGAVMLLVRDGKVAYYKAYGYSNVETKTLLKKDDIFRIASQTKAITSLAVMMLWEEGRFLLDEPVSNYISEFKAPTVLKTFNPADSSFTTEPAKSEITIRQLLTHTSGIDYAAIGSNEFKAIYAKATIPSGIGNNDGLLAEKIKRLATLPLKHHPGERWTYGLNTDVLGYLVELLSGMPFDQFLRSRIFEPIGMKDTYFFLPKDKQNRMVALHHEDKNKKVVRMKIQAYDGVDPDYPKLAGTYFSGGAGLSSTVEDYSKFLQLFLNKGEYNGVRLLSRKTVEMMLTDQIPESANPGNEFGLGFSVETTKNDYQSVVSLGTFGWAGAYNTRYWADPKERLVGIIFTNVYATSYRTMGEEFKNLVYQALGD